MLIGNYSVLNKGPGRAFGGSTTSVEVTAPSNWQKSGSARNSLYVSGAVAALALYAIPSGNYAGKTWMLPQKSGEMSSRNDTVMAFSATGAGLGGVTSVGSAQLTFTVADATGGLITSGAGSASFAINGDGQLLSSLSAAGTTSFALTTNMPLLGAITDGSGVASFGFSAAATRLPADDAPPSRAASAAMSFSATMTPYALGIMSGSTVDGAALTSDSVAAAVWSKAIEAGYTAEQILRIVAAHAAGAATGLDGANPQFMGLDGATVRIDGAYSSGTRTIDTLNGA